MSRHFTCFALLGVITCIADVILLPATCPVSRLSASTIFGGGDCEITNWASCATCTTLAEACSYCQGKIKCDNSVSNEACIDLPKGADYQECGTCQAYCGGTERNYSQDNCMGTFTTASCPRTYTNCDVRDYDGGEC